jgi:toxin ParE1/3/4
MKRRLRWTKRSLRSVESIGNHISKDNAAAADRVIRRLQSAAENLSTYPGIGRVGRIAGTRELVLADMPYIIAYRIIETDIEILMVMHTSRRWPEEL